MASNNIERFSVYRGSLALNLRDGEYVRYSDHERIVQELEARGGFPVSSTSGDYDLKEDDTMTKDYDGFRAGMLRAAEMACNEFKRAPEAAKGHDCIYMSGYEDACDHLSVVIAQAAVIDSVRIAGAQPDWQYHIALLLPENGVDDTALLKIYQVVEREIRRAVELNDVPPIKHWNAEHVAQRLRGFLTADYALIARHRADEKQDRDITGDVEDLLSRLDSQATGEGRWLPIESAPKDDTDPERPASDRVVAEIKRRLPEYQTAKGDLAALMCADIYFLLNERAALLLRHTTNECS
jgi:hypothetical protein